jgi:hypothetical protein
MMNRAETDGVERARRDRQGAITYKYRYRYLHTLKPCLFPVSCAVSVCCVLCACPAGHWIPDTAETAALQSGLPLDCSTTVAIILHSNNSLADATFAG